eukprot:m51a1_g2464 putative methionyl-trna synthetase (758) ;mRNA; f:27189-29922
MAEPTTTNCSCCAVAGGKKPFPVVAGQRNVLVTSALPYVNNVPHLGNIIGCVLSADVYARFCRMRGYNTLYVCGTDEYGTTTEQKAMQEGLSPAAICAKYHAIHHKIYEWFDISCDKFGRTSTEEQTQIAQDIFLRLDANGFITQASLDQHYCPKCDKYLADRFVEGRCPMCDAPGARGDQCDKCQKVYNAIELKDPACKTCGSTPVVRASNHLFLDLPKLAPQLGEYIEAAAKENRWSANSLQVARAWVKDLKPRCITRDLKWGTKVPRDGFEDKVFYVWFDAPIGYISITATLTDDWKQWWMNPRDVELVQFMGKDNIPFHTIIFPASLFGTQDPWTMMKYISTTEYLNYEDDKFSKSRGVGVFGDDAMNTTIPSEVWRYYLLLNRPELADSVFTWDDLGDKCNSELLSNLGNFTNRCLTFVASTFASTIPKAGELSDGDKAFIAKVDEVLAQYIDALEHIRIKDGLKLVMEASRLGNRYMQENQPWALVKSGDMARCATVLAVEASLVAFISVIAEPFMPAFSRKVREQLKIEPSTRLPERFDVTALGGHVIGTPSPIFRKLEAAELKAYRQRFGGQQGAAASAKKMPLDLRVGTVLEASSHPTADTLWVLKVDLGEEAPRQIVSGIKQRYATSAELVGQQVVVVCNLKAAKIRDVASDGMVLCGEDASGYALAKPSVAVPVGSVVVAHEHARDKETLSKKIDIKAFGKIAAHLKVAAGAGTLSGAALEVFAADAAGAALGNVVVPGVTEGKLK